MFSNKRRPTRSAHHVPERVVEEIRLMEEFVKDIDSKQDASLLKQILTQIEKENSEKHRYAQ